MEKNTIWQKILKRYFINGLNGMALGLFCTLIVGLIIKQIGTFIGGDVGTFIVALGNFATMCTGAAIGVGTDGCVFLCCDRSFGRKRRSFCQWNIVPGNRRYASQRRW